MSFWKEVEQTYIGYESSALLHDKSNDQKQT